MCAMLAILVSQELSMGAQKRLMFIESYIGMKGSNSTITMHSYHDSRPSQPITTIHLCVLRQEACPCRGGPKPNLD